MTGQEFRDAVLDIERQHDERLRRLLCRKQAANQAFVAHPGLVNYLDEAESSARQRDEETERLELRFYLELGEDL